MTTGRSCQGTGGLAYAAQGMKAAEQAVAELFRTDAEAIDYLPLFATLPDSAAAAGLSIWWDEAALFRLADQLDAVEIPVTSVEWALDVRWARDMQSLREVLDAAADSAEYVRILRCDLGYPIVQALRGERWVLADGYHRVAKAVLEGHPTISAVRLPSSRLGEVLRVGSPFFDALNTLGLHDPDGLTTVRRIARAAIRERAHDAGGR